MRFFKVILGPKCHWFHGSQEVPVAVQGLSFLEWENKGSSQQNQGSSGWLETTEVGNRGGTGCNSFPLMDLLSQHYPKRVCHFTQPYLRPFCMQHIFPMSSHKETQVSVFLGSILSIWANIKIPAFKKTPNLKQLQNCLWPKEELCGSEEILVLVMVSLKLNP